LAARVTHGAVVDFKRQEQAELEAERKKLVQA
jgi:hypothetical protein